MPDDWDLDMDPRTYLKRWPDGEHADKARAALAEDLNADEPELFRVSSWAGQPNYECPICPFSTLDKAKMERHVKTNEHMGGKYAQLIE